MKRYYLGLDIGTSGLKAGIVDDRGVLLGNLYWDTRLEAISPGSGEIDPDVILAQTLRIIAALVGKVKLDSKQIAGIAIAGQMGGIVGVDAGGNSITGFDTGLDMRSEAYNCRFQEDMGDRLYSLTFGSPRNTPKIMRWRREHPEIYSKVRKITTLNSYIAAKLVGLSSDDAYIDYTQLAFFGNEDAGELQWSEEMTAACDLDLHKFPKVVKPWDCIGGITRPMVQESSLEEGTPVFAGSGDQPAGLLGAAFTRNGSLLDVSGSTTLLFCSTGKFIPDTKHHAVMYMPAIVEGTYYAFTYVNGGGLTLKWFRDAFAPDASLAELSSQVSSIPPGSQGLLFSPYFGGRQCPYDASLRGSWIGMDLNHTKYHLYRSILEGLAYDQAIGLAHLKSLLPKVDTTSMEGIGGGVKDDVWNQMKADVMDIVYHRRPNQQCTLRGCALLVGYGLGEVKDLSSWDHIAKEGKGAAFYPDEANHRAYVPYIEAFGRVFSNDMSDVFHTLSTLDSTTHGFR